MPTKTKIHIDGKAPVVTKEEKIPSLSDMTNDDAGDEIEGSPKEEAGESPKEEKAEGDAEGEGKGNIDKETLKEAMKEVNDEKDMAYHVEGKTKSQLELLIKMAQDRIANKKYSDNDEAKNSPVNNY